MQTIATDMSEEEEDEHTPSRRGPLMALVVILLLLAGGLWLANVLHGVSSIQDCVMSGRRNCVIIQPDSK
jgi:hypothetical protein